MYAVVRQYKSSKLIDALEQRPDEVEKISRPVPGFIAYYIIRTAEGDATVTVCADKAGTDASIQRAAAWIRENLPDVVMTPPEITEGEVIQQLKP